MGLTFRQMHNPLFWRTCPKCKTNLVDAEICEELKSTCERWAFHSRLYGERNPETNEMEYWKCPDCKTVFPAKQKPIIHTMSEAYLKKDRTVSKLSHSNN